MSIIRRFLVGLLLGFVIAGCQPRVENALESRADFARSFVSEHLPDNSSLEDVKRFFDSSHHPYEVKQGCLGNLSIAQTDCARGRTFIGSISIPKEQGGNEASVFVFVHDEKGVLSRETVASN